MICLIVLLIILVNYIPIVGIPLLIFLVLALIYG
jgi:hypothetical protein